MNHDKGTLAWISCTAAQARGVLTRNGIDAKMFAEARRRLLLDEMWLYGPSVYLIDTLTDRAARVTVEGPDEFDVKVSSRTAGELFDDLSGQMPALLDHLVILR